MSMTYVGIDNGVSGSVGIVEQGKPTIMIPTPTFSQLSYTKAKRNITRVSVPLLQSLLRSYTPVFHSKEKVRAFIERPMVNPGRFQATASALRALEATLIVLESLELSIQYVDSREWQKVMLPSGIKGPAELKAASRDIGCRLFPTLTKTIMAHGDADGLLMAEWARRIQR